MHEVPAAPVVRGVMVSHEAVVLAVHVPEPLVRMDPPPPSLVKVRVGGSILTTAQAERVVSQRARRVRARVQSADERKRRFMGGWMEGWAGVTKG
jgi:hypothetical protein